MTFEVIFFDRDNLQTVFGDLMRVHADKVINIEDGDLTAAKMKISAERLDILLYLALGTGKFSYFLAHAR